MSSNNNPFLGRWRLDPTQSQYEVGLPPQSGLYSLEAEGKGLKVTMEWVAADDKSHQLTYFGIPDGKDYPYENPAVADTMSMSYPDAQTLDSTAKKEGRIIAYATRVLSADGKTMTITQSGSTQEGLAYSNLSVYHKIY